MTNKNYNRAHDDDADELWDDDLRPVSGPEPEEDLDMALSEATTSGDAGEEEEDPRLPGASSAEPYNDEDYYGDGDADPDEPEDKPERSKKRRLFGLDKEDEGDDFFDNDTDPEPAKKPKPKPVKLDPEDPDYWIEEESEIARIMPKPKKIWKWWLAATLTLLSLFVAAWVWFFHPYVDGAVKYGYLKSMERRGTLVKTFEGVLIPYRELGDTTPTYFEEIRFSVEGDSLAAHMKGMMLECKPVRLEYKMYHTPLPWKGAEQMIITAADTADVRKILPPEYR